MFNFKRKQTRMAVIAVFLLILSAAFAGCASDTSTESGGAGGSDDAAAPDFPTQPVTFIVTHNPGSSSDTHVRLIAPYIEKYLGQTLVIENMEGAGGRKAKASVFHEEPDGYTIVNVQQPSTSIGELLYDGDYETLGYSYIGNFRGGDNVVIAVSLNSPYESFEELVEASKSTPIKLGTSGTGSTGHLGATLIGQATGLEYDMVPFDNVGDLIMAGLGDQVDAIIDMSSSFAVREDLRPLVLTAEQRSEVMPDVPTVSELGYPAVNIDYTEGIVGPPGMPEEIRVILEEAVYQAASDPEYQEKLLALKSFPLPLTGAEMKAMAEEAYNSTAEAVSLMEQDIQQ